MPYSIKLFKDKNKARIYRNRQRNLNYSKTMDAENKGYRWTSEDERMVLSFKGIDAELSEIIGRGVRAIQIKRTRIKPLNNHSCFDAS